MRVKSAIQRWPPESFCGLPNPDTPTLHLIAPTRKDQFHGGMSHCSQACSKAITQSNTKSPLYFLKTAHYSCGSSISVPGPVFQRQAGVPLWKRSCFTHCDSRGSFAEGHLSAQPATAVTETGQEESSVCRRRAGNRGPLEVLSAANSKPRTLHNPPPGGERRGKRKRLMMFLERIREGHHQSDKRCSCFKGNVAETAEHLGAFPSTWIPTELN